MRSALKSKFNQNVIILFTLLLLVFVFYLLNPNFLNKYNIVSMAQSLAPYAIMGLGVTFSIATGGIDLSIGTVCIASSVVAGKLYTDGLIPLWATIPVMILIGTFFGLIHGLLVAKCKLPAFIATLGTMMVSRGLSAIIVKMGVFGVMRVVYYLFGTSFLRGTWVQYTWITLTLITVFVGSMLAYREKVFKKKYVVVVDGKFEKSKGIMKDYLLKNERNNLSKVVPENTKNSKYAELEYEVIRYREDINLSAVKVDLHTGRHHQIRVQFSSRGHSIYGDQKYGTRGKGKQIALWAYSLTIKHPITKEEMTFEAMPELNGTWSIFKEDNEFNL